MPTPAEPSQAIAQTLFGLVDSLHPQRQEAARRAMRRWNDDDWLAAQLIARIHGITPLLYRLLGQAPHSNLPPDFTEHLQSQYGIYKARIQRLLAICERLERHFRAAGASLLFLKGCYLLRQGFYSDIGLRPMADVDILIEKDDFEAVRRQLPRLGLVVYAETPDGVTLMAASDIQWLEDASLGMYVDESRKDLYRCESEASPIAIDVHFRVKSPLRFQVVDMSELLQVRSDGNIPLSALTIHLVLHNAQNIIDHRLRLVQLYDLHLLLPRLGTADWAQVRAFFERQSLSYLLYTIVHICEKVFGASFSCVAGDRGKQVQRAAQTDVKNFILKYSYCNPRAIRLKDQLALCDTPSQGLGMLGYALNGRHINRTRRQYGEQVQHTRPDTSLASRLRRYLFDKTPRAGFRGFQMHGFNPGQVTRVRQEKNPLPG